MIHWKNPEKASCECHEEPREEDTIKIIYDGSGEGSQKLVVGVARCEKSFIERKA